MELLHVTAIGGIDSYTVQKENHVCRISEVHLFGNPYEITQIKYTTG